MRFSRLAAVLTISTLALCSSGLAQQPSGASAAPQQAPATAAFPPVAGPLVLPAPRSFHLGPVGTWDAGGLASLMPISQTHPDAGDASTRIEFSNAQAFLQKPTGWLQFYFQIGAYNLPSLGAPLYSTATEVSRLYGPVPVAYLQITPSASFNIQAGKLPSIWGGEALFTFQNMNVERGLLWNQTSAINRGVQLNYNHRALTASLSWNDGFYSNRWNWLSGAASYALDKKDTLSATAAGNIGRTGYSTFATPVLQNNTSVYDLIYIRSSGPWKLQPYFQYTRLAQQTAIGADRTTTTVGAAFLASRTLGQHWALAARGEIIQNSGKVGGASLNLIYGPGSDAGSVTLTPTYQRKHAYARGEFSWVGVANAGPGDAFGPFGGNKTQMRGTIEAGVMF